MAHTQAQALRSLPSSSLSESVPRGEAQPTQGSRVPPRALPSPSRYCHRRALGQCTARCAVRTCELTHLTVSFFVRLRRLDANTCITRASARLRSPPPHPSALAYFCRSPLFAVQHYSMRAARLSTARCRRAELHCTACVAIALSPGQLSAHLHICAALWHAHPCICSRSYRLRCVAAAGRRRVE